MWTDIELKTPGALIDELMKWTHRNKNFAWRGQSQRWPTMQSSLARKLPSGSYSAKLATEQRLISTFQREAAQFLTKQERIFLSDNSVGALTVMQHYGAPTRLLDWTHSPWVALYFACIHDRDKDGAIWMFDYGDAEKGVRASWSRLGVPSQNNGDVILNDVLWKDPAINWISALHSIVPFSRLDAQQGLFTVSGALDADHEKMIDGLCSSFHYRFSVKAECKEQCLEVLRHMNVHATSLHYAGADIVGRDMCYALDEAKRILEARTSGLAPAKVPAPTAKS